MANDLEQRALKIQNANMEGENTAEFVGRWMVDASKKIDTKSENVTFTFVTSARKPILISSDGKTIEIINPRLFRSDGRFAEHLFAYKFNITTTGLYYIKATFLHELSDGLSLELIQGAFWADEIRFDDNTFVFAYRDDAGGWYSRYGSVQVYLTVNQIPYFESKFVFSVDDLNIEQTESGETFTFPRMFRMLYNYGFYENSVYTTIESIKGSDSQYILAKRGIANIENSLTLSIVSGNIPTLGNETNLEEDETIVCYKIDGGRWQSFYSIIQSCLDKYYSKAISHDPKIFLSDQSGIEILDNGNLTFPKGLRLIVDNRWSEISSKKIITPVYSLDSCYITAKVNGWGVTDGIELKANAGRMPKLANDYFLTNFEYVLCYKVDGGKWQSDFAPIQSAFLKYELVEGLLIKNIYGADVNLAPYAFDNSFSSGICYSKGSDAKIDGYCNTFTFYALTTGVLTILVGTVDQWGKCIEESNFTIQVTKTGYQTHEVNVPIKKGQILFPVLDIADNNTKIIGYYPDAGGKQYNTLIYNDQDRYGVMYEYAGVNGGYINFSYTIPSHSNNINALYDIAENQKSEITQLKSCIETVANNVIISDLVDGNKYKLVSVNGNLTLKSLQYKKVMVFGNSITRHQITSFWRGDYGMAATTRENDWVHKLQNILRTKIADAEVNAFNIAEWEGNHSNYDYSILDEYLTPDTEALILRIGENVGDITNYDTNFETLIDYIYSKIPTVDIYIGGQFWENIEKENIMKAVATKRNIPFVDFSYMWGNPIYASSLDTKVLGDDGQWHLISEGEAPLATLQAVANHPGDFGMLSMAQDFGNVMGY